MRGKQLSNLCDDCKEADVVLTIRRRNLCRDCYVKFVGYKVFRRTEKYRLRRDLPATGPCPVLLPLSYGLSSSVLLHMVHAQLENQIVQPRAPEPFDLNVLIIEPSTISPSSPPHDEPFELLQQRFRLASFTRLPLHSVFEYVRELDEILPKYAGQGFKDDASLSPKERLDAFRASLTTATSITDVDSILINRLIIAFAKSKDCVGIIWGDSDDRLAAKTLANVAKGRGSSLTWRVSDGASPFGVEFRFPLRDLFIAEIQNYANSFPELADILIPDTPLPENILTKNLSIDQLMMRYVSSQGKKYPGVMSNVTRTANKLDASRMPTDGSRCVLCDTTICSSEGTLDQTRITRDFVDRPSIDLCYACERSRPGLS
ncbi:hypothetical protein BJY04DRAFT_2364 [Aspergillus karnatakaensis]|uniref:uncharacterized protein n=1 Tax=Aspergillus karnatakaensis TaxID=1810916 RepID=UPI003CCCAF84